LLELGLDRDGEVLIVEKASLRVAHWAQSLQAHPVMGGSISLTDEMRITAIWNPIENEITALRVGCMGSETPDNYFKVFFGACAFSYSNQIHKVFSNGPFIFFAHDKGIQAVEIPDFDPLEDDTVILSDLSPSAVESYTAELGTGLVSVQERNVLISASPEFSAVYDLVVKDTEADSCHIHRHLLNFDPELPDEINLVLVEVAKCGLSTGSSELVSQHKVICDGQVAYLWVPQEPGSWASPNQAYISLSPPISRHVNKAATTRFSAIPFYEKDAEDIYEFGLCPVSGVGIGLKGSAIEVNNISRGCRA
jgi:hypothetical protein